MSCDNIGILGGSFDPIHLGHLWIAQYVAESLSLDKVLFIPAGHSPFKNQHYTTAQHRYSMVQLSVVNNRLFELSDYEINKQSKSYTVETLEHLSEKFPGSNLHLITGMDAFKSISTWHRASEILELATLIVADRGVLPLPQINCQDPKVVFLNNPSIGISSSMLRGLIAQKKSIKYLVTDPVNDYIFLNRLYH